MEASFSTKCRRKNNFQRFIKTSQECSFFVISDNEFVYVDGRYISESVRLIADVLQITDVLNFNGMLVTVDIQKAFDSVNLQFLILTFKKYIFSKTNIKWIQTLIK